MTSQTRTVCIVIFDEVEVLDFCGPFDVFSVTGGRQGLMPFEVCTVAESERLVKARGGLSINPTFTFETCPSPDILLIPKHRKANFARFGLVVAKNNRFGYAWIILALALAVHVLDEATHDFISFYNPSVQAIRARVPSLAP